MWGLAMKRFHCVPETTTFQALNIGDVFNTSAVQANL
jgi:hypothetical protein